MGKTQYFEPKGTVHFNVMFKSGGMLHRLLADEVCGLRPAEIEGVYIVEQRRKATREEIGWLCKKKKVKLPAS